MDKEAKENIGKGILFIAFVVFVAWVAQWYISGRYEYVSAGNGVLWRIDHGGGNPCLVVIGGVECTAPEPASAPQSSATNPLLSSPGPNPFLKP